MQFLIKVVEMLKTCLVELKATLLMLVVKFMMAFNGVGCV